MNSVPQVSAELSAHPAAVEAAASLRSLATGLRPQWSGLAPVPSRPLRVPAHNARVAGYLAHRQAKFAALGQRIPVAEPRRLLSSVPCWAHGASKMALRSIWSSSTIPRVASNMS